MSELATVCCKGFVEATTLSPRCVTRGGLKYKARGPPRKWRSSQMSPRRWSSGCMEVTRERWWRRKPRLSSLRSRAHLVLLSAGEDEINQAWTLLESTTYRTKMATVPMPL